MLSNYWILHLSKSLDYFWNLIYFTSLIHFKIWSHFIESLTIFIFKTKKEIPMVNSVPRIWKFRPIPPLLFYSIRVLSTSRGPPGRPPHPSMDTRTAWLEAPFHLYNRHKINHPNTYWLNVVFIAFLSFPLKKTNKPKIVYLS